MQERRVTVSADLILQWLTDPTAFRVEVADNAIPEDAAIRAVEVRADNSVTLHIHSASFAPVLPSPDVPEIFPTYRIVRDERGEANGNG